MNLSFMRFPPRWPKTSMQGEMEDRIAHIFMEADHIYIQDVLDVARIFCRAQITQRMQGQ